MRTMMLLRTVVIAGVVSATGLAAAAWAWERVEPAGPPQALAAALSHSHDAPIAPIAGVSFIDPMASSATPPLFDLGARTLSSDRWSDFNDRDAPERALRRDPLRYEVALSLPGSRSGLGLDVSVAQRATFELSRDGALTRAGSGTELRLGQGLDRLVREWNPPTWDAPTWYIFAASDGQALTWRPEQAANFATDGVRLQDRVEVGDFQAGVSLEAGGLQASLAYVQRDVSGRNASAEENFTGVTVTWRR